MAVPTFLGQIEGIPLLTSSRNRLYTATDSEAKKFIKWVDFDVTSEAMKAAFRYDVDSFQSDVHLNWVDLLAFLGAKYGGDFSKYKSSDMAALAESLKGGKKLEDVTKDMKYFSYYREAYGAVLDGMVGTYRIQIPKSEAPAFALNDNQNQSDQSSGSASQLSEPESNPDTSKNPESSKDTGKEDGDGKDKVWVTKYGLKAFHPLAKGFPYSDFDDFGVARSYGFRRQHLGHDMMGQVGSPVIAVESGYIEALGWNQYGGWRIGIRSFDKKRYYYYAHLRKNYPYQKELADLKEGDTVTAGDVIGYLGRTGYSRTENTNNIDEPHLHFGLQLIFDESQKEGNNEIWVNCYELVKFLNMNRSEVVKADGTKEWVRVYQMEDQ
ncbi:M23 family metallopeptidase [Clostridium sp. AM58-1XD]|uniref:M23 family metallopeptidase n=1 Tax=Clostridium sp. AM58-1XD TaxID=2292307 RepID=UPI000E494993|nr:M23 family peptidase [Clostridium sp. AM58-1XD]